MSRMHLTRWLTISAASLIAISTTLTYASAALIPIYIPGSVVTAPFSINNHGQIVGGVAFNRNDESDGFYYDSGRYTIITYQSSVYLQASGINDSGSIIGEYRDPTVPGNIFRGFLDRRGTITSFDIPSSISTFGYAINDRGDTAGGYRVLGGSILGYVDIRGIITTVSLGDGTFTEVTGLANTGDYAGFFHDALGFHGFTNIHGVMRTIDDPGAYYTVVWGMNDLGTVVGDAEFSGGNRHSFLDDGKSISDFPASLGFVSDINNRGQSVGVNFNTGIGFLTEVPKTRLVSESSAVPEPSSLALLIAGFIAFVLAWLRTSKAAHSSLHLLNAVQRFGDPGR